MAEFKMSYAQCKITTSAIPKENETQFDGAVYSPLSHIMCSKALIELIKSLLYLMIPKVL